MSSSRNILGDLISVILIAVLFVVILVLVVFSAVSYQTSAGVRDDNNNTRAVLSYVTMAVKGSAGSRISLGTRGGTDMLIIEEEDTGYEQRIWFQDGKVLEAYALTDEAPAPEEALTIGEAGEFVMSWKTEGLLEIRTDLGTSYVHVHRPGD